MRASVIVVADRGDELAARFAAFARERGVVCEEIDLATAARRVTVRLPEDGPVAVAPDAAWLLRGTGWVEGADDDQLFHWCEQFAALWSAAALTPRPVVNRPSEWGWWSKLSPSACLNERQWGGAVRTREVFSREAVPGPGFLHQDAATGLQLAGDAAAHAPLRSRELPPCRGWDQVIVVGDRGFRITDVELPFELERESVRAAAGAGLCFATVSWGIPADGGDPVLAKVSAFPTLLEVAPVWPAVREALLGLLVPEAVLS